MSRSERLLRLLQAIRSLNAPVTATRLAAETGVSLRSVYRDIDSLRASGARIEGERGYGYTLIEDGTLPPQTLSRIEIEALLLGLAEVQQMGDPALADAARAVLAKVTATLPSLGQQHLLHAVSQVHQFEPRPAAPAEIDVIRQACWREDSLHIQYVDQTGVVSERIVLPLSIVYVDRHFVLLAYCTLREDFRIFRLDRMRAVANTGSSFRPRRVGLLRDYLAQLRQRAANPITPGQTTG
ncbi:helix-turn-helix transcriptional regulator [Amantichitinum ursilacus]|uniref:Bifunctional ligase/repressor BirA n=1 Tax=Amantichitinum ursilacus TaxID=857265 RepID=A0A0N0XG08_9NEIS|nr:YafY family protein [Amantichitinum ursilacus]KPC49632.1 Bifunctional ligase/repressor BirA [Amantichitinum ursilacus]